MKREEDGGGGGVGGRGEGGGGQCVSELLMSRIPRGDGLDAPERTDNSLMDRAAVSCFESSFSQLPGPLVSHSQSVGQEAQTDSTRSNSTELLMNRSRSRDKRWWCCSIIWTWTWT